MAGTRYITPEEYAQLRRMSMTTVYRHLKRGVVPGAEQPVPGGAYRIPVDAALVQASSAA